MSNQRPNKNRKERGPRSNGQIRAKEVRVIDPEGNQLGVMPTPEAIAKAENFDLDLVEVAPDANPPVCRITNLSKMMYQKERAAKAARKHQKRDPHQLRLRPNIAAHDLDTKVRATQKFLLKGDQVHFVVQLKGRMQSRPDLGEAVLEKILQALEGQYQEVKPIARSGAQVTMTIGPQNQK